MKFWLVFMIFANNGEYVGKMESEYESFGSCAVAAGMLTTEFLNTSLKTQAYCVTNDHYTGVSQDEGIPLDLIEEDSE